MLLRRSLIRLVQVGNCFAAGGGGGGVWWWRIGSRLASTESETAVNVRMFSSDLGQFGFELVADCMDWLEIEWIHSFLGKIKLNADSCAKSDWGKAGFRGLFKDEKKSWILGYSGKLDVATCLEAEIWAIYCGTTIIHEKGCKVLRLRRTVKKQ